MKKIATIVATIGLALGLSSCGAYEDHREVCTIAGKDRAMTGHGKDAHTQMRVYTEECGTFEVADSLFKGQWNSADLFGKLKEGERYELTYHGYRNGFFSMFPNITAASEVE